VVLDEALEVLDIQEVQDMGVALNTIHLPDNFPSSIPESKNTFKSSQGNAEIVEDCWLISSLYRCIAVILMSFDIFWYGIMLQKVVFSWRMAAMC